MGALIEGRHALVEALRSGTPLERIYVVRGSSLAETAPEAARLAASSRTPVETVERRWLEERSQRGAHQGVMALVASFEFTPLQTILASPRDETRSLLIALDHVTDAGNLGAIARSAEVVGADGLITLKRRSAPLGLGAYKASAGALSWLRIAQEPNLVRALETCKKSGYWVLGGSEHSDTSLWDVPIEARAVIVLGSEDRGLSRLVAEACDYTASLPVQGHIGSLNVAQAASVFMYEWLRRTWT